RQATAIRNRVDDDGHGQGTLLVRTVDGGYRAIHSTVKKISTLSGEPAFILGELRLARGAVNGPRAAPSLHASLGDNAA
ncbi:MAG: hypothetical protein ACKOW5_08130, partial [Actinomycetales bacterium]